MINGFVRCIILTKLLYVPENKLTVRSVQHEYWSFISAGTVVIGCGPCLAYT